MFWLRPDYDSMFILHRLVQTVIEPMAKDGLRTICLAYRDFVPTKAEKNQVRSRSNLKGNCRQHVS